MNQSTALDTFRLHYPLIRVRQYPDMLVYKVPPTQLRDSMSAARALVRSFELPLQVERPEQGNTFWVKEVPNA
ncbi:hypothetical protein [Mucilaginibacter sp. CSA2-8R]|uniref:hypothetical protein n=1 Tax=Mucilaginibacter sp. CSA2-8R TaxID=3141542 RepID=UPI00315C5A47